MGIAERVREKAKRDVKRIVLPEGDEARTVQAAAILQREGLAEPVLLGKAAKIRAAAVKTGADIGGIELTDPAASGKTADYARALYELRRRDDPSIRARLRAFLAGRLWFVASREFPRSVWHARAVFDGTYKGDQSAARYELMSIIWLAELLFPECTRPCEVTMAATRGKEE